MRLVALTVVLVSLVLAGRAAAQTWAPVATLARPGMLADQSFGYAVAMEKGTIVAGAPWESGAHTNGGAVYVLSGPSWSDVVRIEGSNLVDYDSFGLRVGLGGDTVLVGNGWIDNATVWVVQNMGGTWMETQRLQEANTGAFGFALIVNADTALIASPKDGADRGKVHVYERIPATPGSPWTEMQEIAPSDPMDSDFFSYGMAWDGGHVVISAPGNYLGPPHKVVYTFSDINGRFLQTNRLEGTDSDELWFGSAVAVSGDTLVVAACPVYGYTNLGKALVYTWSGTAWTLQQELTAAEEEQFPSTVALQGDDLWLGATTGMTWTARAYLRTAGTWTQVQKMSVPLNDITVPQLALDRGTLAVGIPYDAGHGTVQVFGNGAAPPGTGGSGASAGSGGAGGAAAGGAGSLGSSGSGGTGGGGTGGSGIAGTGSGGSGTGGSGAIVTGTGASTPAGTGTGGSPAGNGNAGASGTGGGSSANGTSSGCSCTTAPGASSATSLAAALAALLCSALRRRSRLQTGSDAVRSRP